jgi:hypothetical protein
MWILILKNVKSMGKLNLVICDELDEQFRSEVAKRLGMRKGNLTKAIEQAIDLWLKTKKGVK